MFWAFLHHPGVPPLCVFVARAPASPWRRRAPTRAAESLAPRSGLLLTSPWCLFVMHENLGGSVQSQSMQGHQQFSDARDVGRDQLHLGEISLASLMLAERKTSPAFSSDLHLSRHGSLFCFSERKWTRAKFLLFCESSLINGQKEPIIIPEDFTSTPYDSLSPLMASPRCSTRGLEEEPFFRSSTARDCLPSGGMAILVCPPTPRARKYQRN